MNKEYLTLSQLLLNLFPFFEIRIISIEKKMKFPWLLFPK